MHGGPRHGAAGAGMGEPIGWGAGGAAGQYRGRAGAGRTGLAGCEEGNLGGRRR